MGHPCQVAVPPCRHLVRVLAVVPLLVYLHPQSCPSRVFLLVQGLAQLDPEWQLDRDGVLSSVHRHAMVAAQDVVLAEEVAVQELVDHLVILRL